MDLDTPLKNAFIAACDTCKAGGFTDIVLSCNSSYLRRDGSMKPIRSPSNIAIAHLVEVITGREHASKLIKNGGEFISTWNGIRVAIVKLVGNQPFHIVVRLDILENNNGCS